MSFVLTAGLVPLVLLGGCFMNHVEQREPARTESPEVVPPFCPPNALCTIPASSPPDVAVESPPDEPEVWSDCVNSQDGFEGCEDYCESVANHCTFGCEDPHGNNSSPSLPWVALEYGTPDCSGPTVGGEYWECQLIHFDRTLADIGTDADAGTFEHGFRCCCS